MLSRLATVQAKEVEIIWYADLDGHVLTTPEKTLCRKAIDVTRACMTGKGTAEWMHFLDSYVGRERIHGAWLLLLSIPKNDKKEC